jgi:hypothetical protein
MYLEEGRDPDQSINSWHEAVFPFANRNRCCPCLWKGQPVIICDVDQCRYAGAISEAAQGGTFVLSPNCGFCDQCKDSDLQQDCSGLTV